MPRLTINVGTGTAEPLSVRSRSMCATTSSVRCQSVSRDRLRRRRILPATCRPTACRCQCSPSYPGGQYARLPVQRRVTGMYLGVALAASHVGMPAVRHAGWIDIFHRQVPHSRNVRSRLASLAMGSLNHQVSLTCCRTRPNPSAQSASRHPRGSAANADVQLSASGDRPGLEHRRFLPQPRRPGHPAPPVSAVR